MLRLCVCVCVREREREREREPGSQDKGGMDVKECRPVLKCHLILFSCAPVSQARLPRLPVPVTRKTADSDLALLGKEGGGPWKEDV